MRNTIIKNLFIICFISISSFSFSQAQETKEKSDYALSVNGKTGEVVMTIEELKHATFDIQADNPELAGKVSLKEYSFKCPDQPTVHIRGGYKIGSMGFAALMKSKSGDKIIVSDPIYRIDGKDGNYHGGNRLVIKLK